jgi:hypothetical protein
MPDYSQLPSRLDNIEKETREILSMTTDLKKNYNWDKNDDREIIGILGNVISRCNRTLQRIKFIRDDMAGTSKD